VVQAYLTGPPRNGGGPVRVLGAFTGVMAAPGEVADVTLLVPARMFAAFDEEAGQWSCPGGEFTVRIGRSSRDLRLSLTVRSG
jgi:beta-glucosidase